MTEDYELCSPDAHCPACDSERERRAARDAERALSGAEAVASASSPVLRDDGTLPVPNVIEASALLTALDGDGRVTLTRSDARRVVATLATQRAPGDEATITNLRERLDQARDAHRRDIETIGDALIEQAEDRGWCEIFDSVVEELNGNLSIPLRVRARDVTIYLSDEEGTNHFYVTVSISGEEDEGDAARQVLDALRGQGVVNDWGYA
jgi:hypothetical protein